MGCCKSKPTSNISNISTATPQHRRLADRIIHRRTTHIHNRSSTHAYIAIAPSPVSNLASINIDKLGGLEFNKQGEYLSQAFKLMAGQSRELKVDSHRFYIGTLLLINEKWHTLWDCREFSANDDIVLLERHIEEAKLTGPTATPTCLANA
jgi:hypothetical protein